MKTLLSDKIIEIKEQFIENKYSHIFLIETNDTLIVLEEIKKLIIGILKSDEISSKQIENETYLENYIIKPDGKNIKKEQVLELQKYISNKPILNEKKFYTILNMEYMNEIAQNKMLKFIEEPPDGVIGFLITSNSDSILPTIKSRCEYLIINYNRPEEKSKLENIELLTITNELIQNIETKKILDYNLNKNLNKFEVEKLINYIQSYYKCALGLESNVSLNKSIISFIKNNNSTDKLIKKNNIVNSIYNKLTKNISDDLILELLYLELERI